MKTNLIGLFPSMPSVMRVLSSGSIAWYPTPKNRTVKLTATCVIFLKRSQSSQFFSLILTSGRFPFIQNFRKLRWKGPSGRECVPPDTSFIRYPLSPKFKMAAQPGTGESLRKNMHFHRNNRTIFSKLL